MRKGLSYRLCDQTVTVYHKDGEVYTRTVYPHAYFEHRKADTVDRVGERERNGFLLVIPCSTQAVFVGDKVLRGIGADISTREEWAALIPAKVPDLAVVRQAEVKYWGGRAVHTEATG